MRWSDRALARSGIVRPISRRFAGDLCHCKSATYSNVAALSPDRMAQQGRFRASRPFLPVLSVAYTEGGRSPRGSADRNAMAAVACVMFRNVAPRAGARIETVVVLAGWRGRLSLPARERGSKLARRKPREAARHVAPRAGARIETASSR